MEIKKRKFCAICGCQITMFFDLGAMPLANHLLEEKELGVKEKTYPLTLCFCKKCFLVQLGEVVSPDVMYKDYLYIPSGSKTLVSHFEELCRAILKFGKKQGFVLDVGSNDGTLLRFFKKNGYKTLGVDPAEKIAEVATMSGVLTLPKLFNLKEAKKIRKEYGEVDVVTATNVFAHVENLFDLYAGVSTVLSARGICVVEVSYLLDMINNLLFDSIYHEHLYYFSVHSLLNLFEKTSLEIFDIDHVSMHGGSLRIWLKQKINKKIEVKQGKIQKFIKLEKNAGILDERTYFHFGERIGKVKNKLLKLLAGLKKRKARIVAYGAPAKGNVLLNYFNIGKNVIDFVVDNTSYKQFRYTPGNHLQILPEETIYIEKPDYLLVLAWNFFKEIKEKNVDFKGGYILPLPMPKIV